MYHIVRTPRRKRVPWSAVFRAAAGVADFPGFFLAVGGGIC